MEKENSILRRRGNKTICTHKIAKRGWQKCATNLLCFPFFNSEGCFFYRPDPLPPFSSASLTWNIDLRITWASLFIASVSTSHFDKEVCSKEVPNILYLVPKIFLSSPWPGQFYVVDAVGLRVLEGVSVVIPPTVPLLCHAGLRPVDLLPLALIFFLKMVFAFCSCSTLL